MAPKVESKAKPRRRRNPAPMTRHPAAVREGIPASRFNLTPAERALLPDPDWVTEDDADVIISLRRERTEKPIPLERVLKRYGYRVEG